MIAYIDTSAVVPILIEERSTGTCRRVWDDADRLVSSALTYVEVAAALAMAERQGRISARTYDKVWTGFTGLWPDVDVVHVTADITTQAATLARPMALRGYDSVHCASALAVADGEFVAAAGDLQLLEAWRLLGLAVLDVNQGA